MTGTDVVQLKIRLPRELKERLDAMAAAEDRPLAGVVRRLLLQGVETDEAGQAAVRRLEALGAPSLKIKDPTGGSRVATAGSIPAGSTVPIGGQDAASGAGVEARREEDQPDPAVLAAVKTNTACRHPEARRLGSRCGVCDAPVGPVGTIGGAK